MGKIPTFILKAIMNDRTSLGKHPSLPPEQEDTFLVEVVSEFFEQLNEEVPENSPERLEKGLDANFRKCVRLEKDIREDLERICSDFITDMFNIPPDTLEMTVNISDKIDTSNHRETPEKTPDFKYDDIESMERLTREIYKRRLLNCLVTGASMYYSKIVKDYMTEVFELNSDLPSLYNKIMLSNMKLLYVKKDSDIEKSVEGGKVDVIFNNDNGKVKINAEGVILPILIEESIKGILELAISHGLPSERKSAEFVVKKADFKLAEKWDMRLGLPLWAILIDRISETNYSLDELGVNYVFMQISMLPVDEFDAFMKEVFRGTTKGIGMLSALLGEIEDEKNVYDIEDDEMRDLYNEEGYDFIY